MCELIRELKNKSDFDVKVLVTGQHRGMLRQALEGCGITADHDLEIMKVGQTLSYITSEVLSGADEVIARLLPDIVRLTRILNVMH
jgi:UDP-N-acetylglucosamine 2-epimerase